MPAEKREERLRERQKDKLHFSRAVWQSSHVEVEKRGGQIMRGDLKCIEVLAAIVASPFLFWIAVTHLMRMIDCYCWFYYQLF